MEDDWRGENPFYLIIRHLQEDGAQVQTVIDLDEPGWTTTYASVLRLPSRWTLIQKMNSRIVLAMIVHEGDQPYYVARHVGIGSASGIAKGETIAYGIGKKKPDGHVDRLWYFRDVGLTCGGDDVSELGIEIVKAINIYPSSV